METYCYKCNTALSDKNMSNEHILPKSIGGRITSYQLLCKTCNNLLGHKIDNLISVHLAEFFSLLSIKNSNGEYTKTKIKLDNGKSIELDPSIGIVEDKPHENFQTDGNKFSLAIISKSKKQMIQYFNKYKNPKYSNLQINEVEYIETHKYDLLKDRKSLVTIPKGNLIPAISKIAIGYYLFNGGSISKIKHLIDNLDKKNNYTGVFFYYPVPKPKHSKKYFYNIIHLISDPSESIEYIYIEIFGTCKYMIIIDPNYQGPFQKKSYIVDPISNKEISFEFSLKLTNKMFNRLFSLHDKYEKRFESHYHKKREQAWNIFDKCTRDKKILT